MLEIDPKKRISPKEAMQSDFFNDNENLSDYFNFSCENTKLPMSQNSLNALKIKSREFTSDSEESGLYKGGNQNDQANNKKKRSFDDSN